MQLLASASRLAQGTLSSGTRGAGDTPGGGEEKAGPVGLGEMVRVRVAVEVATPPADGESVRGRVRVEAARPASIDADA